MQPNDNSPSEPITQPDVVADGANLHSAAALEVEAERWFQSQQAGYDKGEAVKPQWISEHWYGFVKARLFEHLHGRRYWTDFGQQDFGLLDRSFQNDQLLLDRIMDRFHCGQENLEVLQWSEDFNMPKDRVYDILLAINVNRCRIDCYL